jgi:hypothetical protein
MKHFYFVALVACLGGSAFADNMSEIEQVGARHTIELQQTSFGTSESKIRQEGTDHHAAVSQEGLLSSSDIDQRGAGNDARVTQSAEFAFGPPAIIEQLGSGNSAEIFQSLASDVTLAAKIRQEGDNIDPVR